MGFYIVGAAKAGTTLIWSWLKSNPTLFLPEVKEPHYFCFQNGIPHCGSEMDPHYKNRITTTLSEYNNLYQNMKHGQLAGDASPGYLYYRNSALEIKSFDPSAKIICILRNPIDRAFSQFLHHVRDGLETTRDFGVALEREELRRQQGWWWGYHYAAAGLYAQQWENYCNIFPQEQRLLLFFDDLEQEPAKAYQKICAFLNIEIASNIQLDRRVNDTSHLTTVPRNANLHRQITQGSELTHMAHRILPSRAIQWFRDSLLKLNTTQLPVYKIENRIRLRNFYKQDLIALSELANRDLSDWT